MQRLGLLLALSLVACGGKTEDGASPDASLDAGSDASTDTGADAPKPDGDPDFFACSGPGQCVLAIEDCCGPCGFPTLDDLTAVAASREADWAKKVCPDPGAVPCPGCPSGIEKNLVAICEAGRCTGIDLRKHPFSSCTSDADCVLRTSECCECGGDAANPVALNKASLSDYASVVCPPSTGCPDCLPSYPDDAKAVCDPMTKHCVVRR